MNREKNMMRKPLMRFIRGLQKKHKFRQRFAKKPRMSSKNREKELNFRKGSCKKRLKRLLKYLIFVKSPHEKREFHLRVAKKP